MPSGSRFECASSLLTLRGLLRKTRRVFSICFGLGIAAHISLSQIGGFEAEQQAAKPLTTQFVKRAPRLTKPLELKKRPQPKRRAVQREMVAVKARMQAEKRVAGFQPTQVLKGLAKPATGIGRVADLASVAFEPRSMAQAVQSTRESQEKIDMALELLDIEAMDTGRYHALVVQDPEDKRDVRGFCRLSMIYSPLLHRRGTAQDRTSFEWQVEIGFRRLVQFMNANTDVRAEVQGRLALNDKELFKSPWTVLRPTRTFQLGETEKRNLGQYLLEGGFVFADCTGWLMSGMSGVFSCLRNALVESLQECGVAGSIERLPTSHPLYHCYYDLGGPPGGCDAIHKWEHPDLFRVVGYVEGIHVGDRLVTMISGKEYSYGWAIMGAGGYGRYTEWDATPPFRFGVNTIILALTQEGSITHRLMESMQ